MGFGGKTAASVGAIALAAGFLGPSLAQEAAPGGGAASSAAGTASINSPMPVALPWRAFSALTLPSNGSSVAAGAAAAATEAPPPIQAQFSGSLKESWSDNIALTSTQQRHDEITSIDPSVNLSARSGTTDLELSYNGGYDRYVDNTDFDGFHHNGIATFNTSLFDKALLFNAQGSVSEPSINPNAASAAGDRASPVNRVRVLNYSGGPQLEGALEDLAIGLVGVTHSQSVNQQISSVEDAQQNPALAGILGGTSQNAANLDIRSGTAFSTLVWDLTGSASEARFSTGTLDQQSYQLADEYKLSNELGILTSGGYDYFHGVGISSKLNGVFYNGGLHWTPSPRTDLRFGGGWRDDKPNIFGLLSEQIGALTHLNISHEVKITSDALNSFDTLETLQRSTDGSIFIDPLTRLAAAPGSSASQLNNAVYRQSTTTGVLTQSDERNTFSLTAMLTSQEVLSNPASNISSLTGIALSQSTTTASSTISWSHRLDRQLTVTVSGNINDVVASSLPTGKSKRATASADLDYQLSAYTDINLHYDFSASIVPAGSDLVSQFGSTTGRIREDVVYLALKRKF